MKYYYAIFKSSPQAIEVEFPDLPGCVTFGSDWDEALANATDVLAGWLAHAQPEFRKEPTPFSQLNSKGSGETFVPIAVDEKTLQSYRKQKSAKNTSPRPIARSSYSRGC
ncbi:type II toxin-antitoxin system HicB family antitoxin [candidate division KSB1 bacterium]|nr:type II toxin-antitoxin system HicB family antitoxin [candidate division KSB1 bacterium]